ncbi:MAG: hypothetical protein LBR11_13000 [Deltaproteobacteria bacterium]|jgi:hypothetical protein|nr:hypothetical protein [Deltaproteobacteria bacterium]
MSINSVLFQNSSYVREPALLGVDRSRNYESLAEYLTGQQSAATTAASAQTLDQVDLALDKVSDKMLSEIAALTAEVIKDNPEFQSDYVLAIIEDGQNRQARVYSRAEILASFEGTEEEKAQLAQSLAENPLLTYSSAANLPQSSESPAALALAEKINSFLSSNEKLLNTLDKYGFNPFAAFAAATEEA